MVEVALVVALARVTLTGESAHVNPVEGETVAVRETLPVKL